MNDLLMVRSQKLLNLPSVEMPVRVNAARPAEIAHGISRRPIGSSELMVLMILKSRLCPPTLHGAIGPDFRLRG